MNIVLCTDENYAMPCGVCITSIFENNREEDCNIFVLTKGLEKNTIEHFEQLAANYKQKINIVNIDSSIFDGLKVSNRFREAIYYRFLIPDLLDVEKALYLDCDIIITQNLKELWNTDINGYALAAVEDQRGDDITLHNRIEMYSTYFNSGVLLMNLDYWRKHRLKEHLVDYIYENPERCLYPDQDALNALLENKTYFLDYKFNYQDQMRLPVEQLMLHRSKWWQVQKYLVEAPVVIHYTSNIKPWHLECNYEYKKHFLDYKQISPWDSLKLRRRYKRTMRMRIYNAIVKLSRILCFIKE